MDPTQWLTQYDERLTQAMRTAKAASERLRQVGGTATSPRGEVTVRVSASGTLEDLTLTPATRTLESDQLAELILDTTRAAQRAASAQIADLTAEFFGEGPALDVIKQNIPSSNDFRTDDEYFANPPEITQ